jgi:hypothetical protein
MVWVGLLLAAIVAVAFALMSGGGKPKETSSAAGGTGTAAAPAAVDPAEKAYNDTDAWIASNPTNPGEAARRWGLVEQRFPGTPWASKAGVNRLAAEEQKKAKDDAEAAASKQREEAAKAAADPKVKLAKFEGMVKAFDFIGASNALMDDTLIDAPPGVDPVEWPRRGRRLDFLSKHFVDKMDAGFIALRAKRKAKDVFPGAKDGETIVGANSGGAIVFDGSQKVTVPWSKANVDAFFTGRAIKDSVLDTNDFDQTLVLACLAAEFQKADPLKKLVGAARGLAGDDDAKADQVNLLFGK